MTPMWQAWTPASRSLRTWAMATRASPSLRLLSASSCFSSISHLWSPPIVTYMKMTSFLIMYQSEIQIFSYLLLSRVIMANLMKVMRKSIETHDELIQELQRSNAAEMISRQYKPERNRKNCLPDFCPDILRRGQKFCPNCYLTHQCQLE